MKPTKSLRATNRSLVDEFCNITGADKVLATSLLEACNNNLEMAVNMHMEGIPGALAADAAPAAAQNMPGQEEAVVRAPIPQKQEVLVEGPDQIAFAFRGRRRVARSVFDKFRDFEAEAKRQEEELMRGGEVVEGAAIATASTSTSTSTSGPSTPSIRNRRKMKTLEDLFRPPIDLIYRGTFQAVRDAGVARKRWLMVNIQDASEFPCQVLNRDVWSNSAVKTIVKEHFIFWQVYHDSEEGQRYMMFYRVSEWPHVAILDPRTGERLVFWHKLDAVTFCDLVTEFLTAHPSLDGKSSPPKKKQRIDPGDSIMEADEASQIEAAIKASLAEDDEEEEQANSSSQVAKDDDKDESDGLETFDSDNEEVDYSVITKNKEKTLNGENDSCKIKLKKACDKHLEKEISDEGNEVEGENSCNTEDEWKSYLGDSSDPESKLMLRLPDGSRDIVSMPSTSKLMALVKYVDSKGYASSEYELVTNFPRREISHMDLDITLKDAGLFPQEAVFIQAR
ncbi:hypothetical protein Pmani_030529 [Petrolisthes manimaculis]|uniref:UBX domain-containing protein 7 n=1 Tax=Petrolisthes manimaculis TaxID=1843537 RepID=A0AAE1NX45_9EUCA|nr:hypothetical protein Pmani_037469 [Petrolisthes manimaculis]KAK4297011.1 hypothetical protein Pmani_030529 [Petrolisthes manimaculis]